MDWWLQREHRNDALTVRQQEITTLVAQGLSNKQVGRRLNLREGTVKFTSIRSSRKLASRIEPRLLVGNCKQSPPWEPLLIDGPRERPVRPRKHRIARGFGSTSVASVAVAARDGSCNPTDGSAESTAPAARPGRSVAMLRSPPAPTDLPPGRWRNAEMGDLILAGDAHERDQGMAGGHR